MFFKKCTPSLQRIRGSMKRVPRNMVTRIYSSPGTLVLLTSQIIMHRNMVNRSELLRSIERDGSPHLPTSDSSVNSPLRSRALEYFDKIKATQMKAMFGFWQHLQKASMTHAAITILYPRSSRIRARVFDGMTRMTHLWPDRRGFLIVPERMKADTERHYLESAKANGLMMAEILSFNRFATSFL